MKKVLAIVLMLGITLLAGCTTDESNYDQMITELEGKVAALEAANVELNGDLTDLESTVSGLSTSVIAAETTITDLEDENAALAALIDQLVAENQELAELVKSTNSRIKNALDRENWALRKIRYNADFSSYEAEYCFGVFDEDWSTIVANDYTDGQGLVFIITVEEIQWGTEIFVKDSCGNYSEFIYQSSPYAMYSIPAGFFEEGKTYEVVLYKDVYFTVEQLGLLPVSEMGDFGSYPTDLSGIKSEEQ